MTHKDKIEITQDQYEELYQKYLVAGKGIDNPTTRKFFDMLNLKKYKIVNKKVL